MNRLLLQPIARPKLLVLAVAAALSSAPLSAEGLFEETVVADMDWQPMRVIPLDEQDRACRQCGGRFADPLADADLSQSPTEADLEVYADGTEVTEGELLFRGNVSLKQGYRQVTADQVTADRARETATATGNVVFREPGILIRGSRIDYDSQSEEAVVTDARYVIHDRRMVGAADQLKRSGSGQIAIDDGRMTYCSPDDPDWVLHANTLEIDPESGDAQAWGAKLKVADVPVLYLPWIRFPVDSRRKTGLLFPDIGSDTRGGIDITAPIYLNLAPNYDLLYRPRYIQERGFLHQGKFRWLSENMGYWELDGGWIGDDSKYEEEFPLDDGSRWLVGAKHNGHFGDNWYTRINYTRVSDTEYLRDLNNSNLSAQRETALQQLARLAWINDQWQVTLDFEQFQSIAEDIPEDYRKLPQMTARWVGNREWLGLTPLFLSQLSYFDSDVDRVTGQRVYSEFGLTKPMNWTAGFFTPTVKYRAVNYELDRPSSNIETSPNAGSLMTSLDSGLIFERQTSLFGQSMTQTLEPRAYYLYSQYEEQRYQPSFDSAELTFGYGQLFRDTRFSGNDRLDDANQLSIGVTSRYFDNETGEEKLSASLGQIYYFRDREIRLSPGDPALAEATSPLAGEFTWSPTQQWKLRASALYDPNDNTFDAASAQATYFPSSGAVLSAGYTLREPPPSLLERPVTEQANVSAYVPLNDDWSLFGALEYSLEGSTAVEDMVGFEFDNCCWRIRILYMRYIDTERGEIPNFSDPDLDRENAIQVQFLLKGMGGFGGRVDNLLGDMIRGFAER
ncbi:MAG: organic solvent tolerance protein [Flavobacteriales bacterium]|nr:organic solvent tolerance protein [Flavobacteriales bacterium]